MYLDDEQKFYASCPGYSLFVPKKLSNVGFPYIITLHYNNLMGQKCLHLNNFSGFFSLIKHYLPRLELLIANGNQAQLLGGLKGIEKESLRISKNGFIAQTPHPDVLGSALTHPHITTDYSEALMEFITPPFAKIDQSLEFLKHIHQFVYDNLQDEILLATSMPCGINGDKSIPIAQYGNSNVGTMKHVYRRGLGYRYGRTMQAIAGIHFNYSVPEGLWPVLQHLENSRLPLEQFIADAYFGMIRNFQRLGWIILYLFGGSPAICCSFFKSQPELMKNFDYFDQHTLYHPYATSLRMSDIGYKSATQAGLKIDYNSLPGYVDSLSNAIETSLPEYEEIGVKIDGEYRQLNSNILQIENEYYSTIRPKQIAKSCEKPTLALHRRGVRYIEVRSLDLDLFNPIGIDENRACFLEALLLTCLMHDSPASSALESEKNNANQLLVAYQGRQPGLQLQRGENTVVLTDWANEILDAMQAVCEILDAENPRKPYTESLAIQRGLVQNAELTPSARILAGMRHNALPFAPYALNISARYEQDFRKQRLAQQRTQFFEDCARESHFKQKEIEAYDQLSFDEFLQCYFNQNCENLNC